MSKGTSTVSWFSEAVSGVLLEALLPVNVTPISSFTVLKFAPVMVSVAPRFTDPGLKAVITGTNFEYIV